MNNRNRTYRVRAGCVHALRTIAALALISGPLAFSRFADAEDPEPDPRVVIDGVRQTDLKQVPWGIGLKASSVRKAAADGVQAPQIGLNPKYAKRELDEWQKQVKKFPEFAAPYDNCVVYFRSAIEQIKAIAPLTRRPTWDYSAAEIQAAVRQAGNLVRVGDECMNNADAEVSKISREAHSVNQQKILQGRVEHDRLQDAAVDEGNANTGPQWPGGVDPNVPVVVELGAYDPCQNPRRPPWCGQTVVNNESPTYPANPTLPSGADPNHQPVNGPSVCFPKADLGAQMYESLRGLVQASSRRSSNLSAIDEFFFQMAAGVRHGLEDLGARMRRQMIGPRLGPSPFLPSVDPDKLAPIVKDIVFYVNNESARPEMEASLRRKAVAAVEKLKEQAEREPGYVIGEQLPQMFVEHCTHVGSVDDAARIVSEATEEARALNRAAAKLSDVDTHFQQFVGSTPGNSGRLADALRSAGLPAPRNNLMMAEKNCHNCVKASLYERETGTNVTAPDVGPLSRSRIVDDLRRSYGEVREAPPGLSPEDRLQWHEGIPFDASGPTGLRQVFEDGGVGSMGFVYYSRPVPTLTDPRTGKVLRYGLEGHALEIVHEPSGVHLNDPQSGFDDVWDSVSRDMQLYGVSYYPTRLGGP